MRRLAVLVLLLGFVSPASPSNPLTSPYREQQTSEIRGLSEKEIRELREGMGMGLARAADSN